MGAPLLGLAKSVYANENNGWRCIVYERTMANHNFDSQLRV